MKALNLLTLVLVIIGGLNWLLIGLFQFDLVAVTFGGHAGSAGVVARIVYVLVGLSAIWQLMPLFRAVSLDEPLAESGR